MSRIYVASSWRNKRQPEVVAVLGSEGHTVYDFRNPTEGDSGFSWSDIDPNWELWDRFEYQEALKDPIAESGFNLDFEAMQWADTCVLVMPCGRSAHLEAGYFVGAKKRLIILLDDAEPELMYKMADGLAANIPGIIELMGGS